MGVVPHWQDHGLRVRYPSAYHVDVGRPVMEVVRGIASCEMIVASSLHGIIVADAFGIPRRWEPHPEVQGGGFKFHDHASALGMRAVPNEWQAAPRARVAEAVAGLLAAFGDL
jgi:hypothetical protein